MSHPTLDYSSWLFQLIVVLVVVYLSIGLARPALVWATKRSTVAVIAAVLMLLASTAFYLVARQLPGGDDTPAQIQSETPPPLP
ncbi:MAG: hypothetical protein WC829_15835 [Hyphomicrobium sp.]|jgi:protein-S-isoprenylcysteine O-methyltransferase Ste14